MRTLLTITRNRWNISLAMAFAALATAPVPAWAQGMNQTQVDSMLTSILKHAALIPAAFIFILPFMWMLSTSLKSNQQLEFALRQRLLS